MEIRRLYMLVLVLMVCMASTWNGSSVYAATAQGGPIYDAVDSMVLSLQADIKEISGKTQRVAVTDVTVSENLPEDIRSYVIQKIEATHDPDNDFRFVQCKECMSVRAETDGDEVFIRKGVTDKEFLNKVARTHGVKNYAEVNLAYTGTRANLQVNTYDARDGSLSWAKSYDSRVLSLAKAGFRVTITGGQIVGARQAGYPYGVSLFLAERLYGVGEFGLGVLGVSEDGDYKGYIAFGPMFALNFAELFSTGWSWGSILWTMRASYGWFAKSRDISVGSGVRFDIGSIYHISLDYLQGMSLGVKKEGSETAKPVSLDNFRLWEFKSSGGKRATGECLPPSIMAGFGFTLG